MLATFYFIDLWELFHKKSKNVSLTYVRVFRYRVKAKSAQMRESVLMLQGAELSFTENLGALLILVTTIQPQIKV